MTSDRDTFEPLGSVALRVVARLASARGVPAAQDVQDAILDEARARGATRILVDPLAGHLDALAREARATDATTNELARREAEIRERAGETKPHAAE